MAGNNFNINVTAKQAMERMTTFDRIHDMISRIVGEELDLPHGGLVAFYNVPMSLDYRGKPFRPLAAFESQWQRPLMVPNITIYVGYSPPIKVFLLNFLVWSGLFVPSRVSLFSPRELTTLS
jgi:hypothetical protein